MQRIWNIEDQRLLKRPKKHILSGPTLAIPDPSRRLYIKKDWYKYGMGAVLLQADVSAEAKKTRVTRKVRWKV